MHKKLKTLRKHHFARNKVINKNQNCFYQGTLNLSKCMSLWYIQIYMYNVYIVLYIVQCKCKEKF